MWFHPHFRRPVGLYFSPTLNSMYDPAVTGLLQESYDPFMGESRDHFTTPCHWYIGTQCGPSSVGYFNIRPWDLHYSWESWYSYKSQNLSLRILCIIYTIIDPAHLPPMSFWGAWQGEDDKYKSMMLVMLGSHSVLNYTLITVAPIIYNNYENEFRFMTSWLGSLFSVILEYQFAQTTKGSRVHLEYPF